MNGADVIAEILKREGTEFLACYPRNPLIEACAAIDIRPILCRQERVGVGMADGFSRIRRGRQNGVFAAQNGPGIENAFPGVAQAYSENVPLLVIPAAAGTERQYIRPNFRAADVFAPVTKWCALASSVQELPDLMRRAFQAMRSGKPGPVLVEVPNPVFEATLRGQARLRPGADGAHGARSRRRQGGGEDAARRQEAGAVGRPGRALCGRERAARRARRADPGAGGRHQPGQERDPREPSARARRRDAVEPEDVRDVPEGRRSRARGRLEPHQDELRTERAVRQDAHPFDQRSRAT